MRRLAILTALASASAIGISATAAELQRGRLMRGPDHVPFPSWRFGPNGQSAVFESEDDVPTGWVDHPSKLKDEKPEPNGTKTAVAPANSTTTAEAAAKTTAPKSQIQVDPAVAAQSGVGGEGASSPAAAAKAEELDTDGHPFDPALHAATKSKTKDGKWRMKVGVKRPAPAPGYPLDL